MDGWFWNKLLLEINFFLLSCSSSFFIVECIIGIFEYSWNIIVVRSCSFNSFHVVYWRLNLNREYYS